MTTVTEIRVTGGIGRVWEKRPGHWGFAHPDGSEGEESTFHKAVKAVEAITTQRPPMDAEEQIERLEKINAELLAALKSLLDAYAPGAEANAKLCGEDCLHSSVKSARAAIAKAEGRA